MPPEQLPMLLGEIEVVRCTAMARLTSPAPAQDSGPDELLDVEEAAQRMSVTVDHLYRHSADYPFTRRVGGRLRFSALGMDDWIRGQDGAGKRTPINRRSSKTAR